MSKRGFAKLQEILANDSFFVKVLYEGKFSTRDIFRQLREVSFLKQE